MLPVNPAWKEGSMMDLIETTPKMDLALHDIEHLVEELRAYHAIYSPLFQRREQREAAHTYLRSEEHTSELQSPCNLVCRLLLEKKKKKKYTDIINKLHYYICL